MNGYRKTEQKNEKKKFIEYDIKSDSQFYIFHMK